MATPKHELEKYQDPESKYRTLFNQAGDGIVLIDAKTGYIIDCNPEFEKQTGRSLQELKKKRIWEIRPPELMDTAKETFISLKKVGEIKPVQTDIQRPDGTIVPVEFTSRELTIKGKHYFQSISRNVARRLKYEEELRKSEEKLARLVSIVVNSNDAIITKTLSGIITEWNKGAENIYGYTAKEVIGRPISMLAPPEYCDEMKQILAKIKRDEPVDHFETRRVRKNGRVIDVSITVSPLKDKPGHIFGASTISREITKRKQDEKLIADQQQAIRELSTPVLPVKARMLVLPLIGVLDTFRARQMTMQLLSSIREQRAKVAVLDVTGVAVMDSAVANHLIQTVQAASLLGAVVIITGISAENAQTLARLGVDLEGFHTYIDLQSGIEAAEQLLSGMHAKKAA